MKDIVFDPEKFWDAFLVYENNNRKEFEAHIEHMLLNSIELREAKETVVLIKTIIANTETPSAANVCAKRLLEIATGYPPVGEK